MARPALAAEEIQSRVTRMCDLIAEGKTLRQVSAELSMSMGTMLRMVQEEPFSEQYMRARDFAADIFEADIIEAAQACTSDSAASDRVKIDALKWVAARRAQRRYGDKVEVNNTGLPMVIVRDLTGRKDEPAADD
jgi:hypothetical protein